MGGGQSVPIPGGGTEGYHVLRVCSGNIVTELMFIVFHILFRLIMNLHQMHFTI